MAAYILVLLLIINSSMNSKGEEGLSLIQQFHEQVHKQLPELKSAIIPSSIADEIFFYIMSYYAPVDAKTQRCRNDSNKYVEAALRNDLWAMQMFDASSKLEPGILDGNFQGLGNFESCLSVDTPEQFIGQLCVVEILGLTTPVMKKFNATEKDSLLPTTPFNPLFSMCVPSTCSYDDVQTHMNEALKAINAFARLTPRSCSTRYPELWETKDYVAVYIIGALISLVLLSSFYDYLFYSDSKVKSRALLSSFSLYRNVPKLSTKSQHKELPTINGLRFIAIAWIVIGHRYIIGFSVPKFNQASTEFYLQYWPLSLVHSVPLAVEIFFVLSGLLVAYTFLKYMDGEKNAFKNIPKFYFHRYMRITPVYVVMILVDGIILYHLSSGPLWKKLTGAHRDVCSENWWPGLLYISNYYYGSTFRSCVAQTWYLSVDMQLFVISPLLLIPLHKKPKLGLSLIFGCFMAVTTASFLNSNYYQVKAGGLLTATRKTERNFQIEYIKTHLRTSSYFMGLALGYFVYRYKQGFLKVNLSKPTLFIGWLASTAIMIAVILSVMIFQDIDYNAPQFVDSLYIALHRPMFSVGIVWVIFVGITGYGGFVNRMLSLPITRPLATLTYGIYMTHLTFQTAEISRTRLPVDYSIFDLMVKSSSDLVASIVAAAVMFLVVEAPFIEIDKWLFSKGEKEKEENHDQHDLPVHHDKTHL